MAISAIPPTNLKPYATGPTTLEGHLTFRNCFFEWLMGLLQDMGERKELCCTGRVPHMQSFARYLFFASFIYLTAIFELINWYIGYGRIIETLILTNRCNQASVSWSRCSGAHELQWSTYTVSSVRESFSRGVFLLSSVFSIDAFVQNM